MYCPGWSGQVFRLWCGNKPLGRAPLGYYKGGSVRFGQLTEMIRRVRCSLKKKGEMIVIVIISSVVITISMMIVIVSSSIRSITSITTTTRLPFVTVDSATEDGYDRLKAEFDRQLRRWYTSIQYSTTQHNALQCSTIWYNIGSTIHTYMCISLSLYIYIYVSLFLSLSLSIYIYIYMYTHITIAMLVMIILTLLLIIATIIMIIGARSAQTRGSTTTGSATAGGIRKGGWYGWKPSSSSNCLIRVVLCFLWLNLEKQFSFEKFEPTVSQSAEPFPPLLGIRTTPAPPSAPPAARRRTSEELWKHLSLKWAV